MADVFISYAHEERDKVLPIVEGFRALGVSVWIDARILPGTSYDEVIGAQLDGAKVILVCWSPSSVASIYVRGEAHFAQKKEKLIPCVLVDCELIPPFNVTQAADLIAWRGEAEHAGWRMVVEQASNKLARPGLLALLDAQASGAPDALAAWAQANSDDPHAPEVWSKWEAAERRALAAALQELHDRKRKLCADHEEAWRLAIAEFQKNYESWIDARRQGSPEPRPDNPEIGVAAPPAQDDGGGPFPRAATPLPHRTSGASEGEEQAIGAQRRIGGLSPGDRRARIQRNAAHAAAPAAVIAALALGVVVGIFGAHTLAPQQSDGKEEVARLSRDLATERGARAAAEQTAAKFNAQIGAMNEEGARRETAWRAKAAEAADRESDLTRKLANAEARAAEAERRLSAPSPAPVVAAPAAPAPKPAEAAPPAPRRDDPPRALRTPARFNCARTKFGSDYVVCASPALMDAMARLEDAYRGALERRGDAVRSGQRAWSTVFGANCGLPHVGRPSEGLVRRATDCVKNALEKRIVELDAAR